MKIIKRSGAEVIFDPQKIIVAISKANDSVVPSARMTPIQIKRIAEDVESAALNINRSLSVEEIQDMVEDQIMNQRAFEVARRYITYRYTRALVRKSNTTDEQILQAGRGYAVRFARVAARFRKELIARYGEERGSRVRFAEAYSLCEYGSQPNEREMRELFSI